MSLEVSCPAMDEREFAQNFIAMAEILGVKTTKVQVRGYMEILREYPDDLVYAAMKRAVKEAKRYQIPLPATLIEHIHDLMRERSNQELLGQRASEEQLKIGAKKIAGLLKGIGGDDEPQVNEEEVKAKKSKLMKWLNMPRKSREEQIQEAIEKGYLKREEV
jgi:predicted DNA-binding protein (UPF0278 family)